MKGIHITDNVTIYNDMPRGWAKGKSQSIWHRKVYHMWIDTWRRIYGDIHWFGSLIDPSFQYLSNYVEWVESQPRFEEFCTTCSEVSWSVDKDVKCPGNKNYYPEYMILMLNSENTTDRNNRNGNPKPKQPVIGIPLDDTKKIILTVSMKDVTKYEFNLGNVGSCIRKILKIYKGYKWYKVNYKHNKTYRVRVIN